MTHAFASNAAMRHFYATTITDHPFIFHSAVFATSAFPVLFWAENAFTKQTFPFRFVGPIVDRLRLFHFAERPTSYVMRTRETDSDCRIFVDAVVCAFGRIHRRFLRYANCGQSVQSPNLRSPDRGFVAGSCQRWSDSAVGFFKLQIEAKTTDLVIQHLKTGRCSSL